MNEFTPETQPIVTPENVVLNFMLPSKTTNFVAFYIDVVILSIFYLITYGLTLVLLRYTAINANDFNAIFILGHFLFHLLYFIYFEIYWQGVTPGKHCFNLRIINKEGLPLTPKSLIIRNLIRDVEVFIPAGILIFGFLSTARENHHLLFVSVLWLFLLMLIPLLNKEGRRLGDFVAGTIVVQVPKALKQLDIVEKTPSTIKNQGFSFTKEHLTYYGIHELQVLEDLLRKEDTENTRLIKQEVAKRIQKRIGWFLPVKDYQAFLEDFYRDQRAYLEKKVVFGVRKERKSDENS